MNLVDWFNIKNIDHINAYHYLQTHGYWPHGFLPEDIEIPPRWYLSLNMKMADQYIKDFLDKYGSEG